MNWTVVSVNLFFCQTMCFYSGQTDRQAGREREGGETLALHAEEHVQRTLGMFRYLLKQLCMGKKGKVILYALTAGAKGLAQFDRSKHAQFTHTYISTGLYCTHMHSKADNHIVINVSHT